MTSKHERGAPYATTTDHSKSDQRPLTTITHTSGAMTSSIDNNNDDVIVINDSNEDADQIMSNEAPPICALLSSNAAAKTGSGTTPRSSPRTNKKQAEAELAVAGAESKLFSLPGAVDQSAASAVKQQLLPHSPANAGDSAAVVYKAYNWRWFVLATVSLVNCFNALSWIAYAPVANRVDDFYGPDTANYLTLVFLIAAIPVGVLAMWSVGRFGIRSAILIAAWCTGIGAAVRLISSVEAMPMASRRAVVISGQVIAACAYPFIMFLPTKVAAAWFPDTQRALANSIATLSNPLGVLLAMLIAPNFVINAGDVIYLNLLICVLCSIVVLLATVGVRSSEPPTHPTRGAAESSMPFFVGIKKLSKSRAFIILFFALGSGIGMFNSLYGMMQQILCARGYTNAFAGLCCVLMIVGGFFGAFASAILVDRTKKFEEIMKVSFCFAVVAGVGFSVCCLRSGISVAIAACCMIFGFFGLAAYPIGLEMAVECSFPVAETTSSGLIVLGGQILGSLYIVGMQLLRQPLTGPDLLVERCSKGQKDSLVQAHDMTVPMITFCVVATLVVLLFVCLFKPKLRRLKLERAEGAAAAPSVPGIVQIEKLASRHSSLVAHEEEMIDLSVLKGAKKKLQKLQHDEQPN